MSKDEKDRLISLYMSAANDCSRFIVEASNDNSEEKRQFAIQARIRVYAIIECLKVLLSEDEIVDLVKNRCLLDGNISDNYTIENKPPAGFPSIKSRFTAKSLNIPTHQNFYSTQMDLDGCKFLYVTTKSQIKTAEDYENFCVEFARDRINEVSSGSDFDFSDIGFDYGELERITDDYSVFRSTARNEFEPNGVIFGNNLQNNNDKELSPYDFSSKIVNISDIKKLYKPEFSIMEGDSEYENEDEDGCEDEDPYSVAVMILGTHYIYAVVIREDYDASVYHAPTPSDFTAKEAKALIKDMFIDSGFDEIVVMNQCDDNHFVILS